MQIITKQFETIKQAERFQNSLYSKYNRVRLVSFPVCSENGTYKWEVSQ